MHRTGKNRLWTTGQYVKNNGAKGIMKWSLVVCGAA